MRLLESLRQKVFVIKTSNYFSSTITNDDSPFVVTQDQAEEFLAAASEGGKAEAWNEDINKWHHVHLQ